MQSRTQATTRKKGGYLSQVQPYELLVISSPIDKGASETHQLFPENEGYSESSHSERLTYASCYPSHVEVVSPSEHNHSEIDIHIFRAIFRNLSACSSLVRPVMDSEVVVEKGFDFSPGFGRGFAYEDDICVLFNQKKACLDVLYEHIVSVMLYIL